MTEAFKDDPIPAGVIRKIYSALVGNAKRPMTLDEFCNLFAKMHYRVIKMAVMTDIFDFTDQPFKSLARLGVGEIVRLIGDVKKTSDGILRFYAETLPPQFAAGGVAKPKEGDSSA